MDEDAGRGNSAWRKSNYALRSARPPPAAIRPRRRACGPLAHRGEEHHFPDRPSARHQHHETVDSDADPARRGHAALERAQEVLVVGLRLRIALRGQTLLVLEAGA